MERSKVVARVDSKDHSLLTVVSLPTVCPDGVGVLDDELSGGKVRCVVVRHRDAIYRKVITSVSWMYGRSTYKLESKPLGIAWHGVWRVDWVTVWFFVLKVNVTVSPTAAF